ncbi:hypothetical protein MHH81_04050 [Psychrobacillus sp. FSL H8-0484]
MPAVQEKVKVLKEVNEDYEMQLNYSTDLDALVGRKTTDYVLLHQQW